MDRWLVDIIIEIQNCNDLSDIKHILLKVKEHLGFSHVAYVVKIPNTFIRSSLVILSDYSQEWLERYGQQGYVNIDPVVSHCFSALSPYLWARFSEHTKGKVHDFIGEAGEFNLRDGISVGTMHPNGKTGLFSLSWDRKSFLTPQQSCRDIIYMNALQPFIHERICQLTEKNQQNNIQIHLTEREKTCLLWVAEGKTAHDIAAILAISEATVVFHLKNAIQKLNVTNRSQAIAKAVLLGLIVPQFSAMSVPTYHF